MNSKASTKSIGGSTVSTQEAPAIGENSVHQAASNSEFDEKKWDQFPEWNVRPSIDSEDGKFEAVLEPLLDRDTKQCNAWQEEVQNLLILAGLFSAVVTAFIIESYRALQPDPNDEIISLLSRIADQMNTPIGNTSLHAASATNGMVFTPAPSNIRINILWFISLVLSLAVALIGIITLQWLREHQRYETGMKAPQFFAIFNARSDGLKRWHVPEILAGLPLLLQAALVLFFVGLVEFLFAIHIDVAIPVVVVVTIPILFLVATTVLPTLQLYAMHLPYFLRVNARAPAPCPYKSPQALIFQRAATASTPLFDLCARALSALWIPIVVTIRLFVSSDKPFYGKSAPFSTDHYHYKKFCDRLRSAAGSWMTMDAEWLAARTSYAVAIRTPVNFYHRQWPYIGNRDLTTVAVFYDCIQALKHVANNSDPTNDTYRNHLHFCMCYTLSETTDALSYTVKASPGDAELIKVLQVYFTALLSIISPYGQQQTEGLVELSQGNFDVLFRCVHAIFMNQAFGYEFNFDNIDVQVWLELYTELTSLYLSGNAPKLFLCSNPPGITPSLSLSTRRSLSHHRSHLEQWNPDWMKYMSRIWTDILKKVIIDTRTATPLQPFTEKCTGSSAARCRSNLHTESIIELTEYILLFQIPEDIQGTLRLLHDLYKSEPNPVQDEPFVLMIACAYINAVANVNQDDVDEFRALLHSICTLCGLPDATLEARPSGTGRQWLGMETALDHIRNHADGRRIPSAPDPQHNDKAADRV